MFIAVALPVTHDQKNHRTVLRRIPDRQKIFFSARKEYVGKRRTKDRNDIQTNEDQTTVSYCELHPFKIVTDSRT